MNPIEKGDATNHYLMPTTLFTGRTRNVRNSTPRINNKSKHLRRSTDPKPCCIVSTQFNKFNITQLISNLRIRLRKCEQRWRKKVYPLRRRSSWSLIRALGWRFDSDPWSWRRGSSADVEELGVVRYRGRIMAWLRLRRNAVSPAMVWVMWRI